MKKLLAAAVLLTALFAAQNANGHKKAQQTNENTFVLAQAENINDESLDLKIVNTDVNSGDCYCGRCERQVYRRWYYEYEMQTCNTCSGYGVMSCKGVDKNGREVLGRWEHCPECRSCEGKGEKEVLKSQYLRYYCEYCKVWIDGCN